MAKRTDDIFLDAFLQRIDDCATLRVVAGEPANRAAAVTNTLASVALTPGDGNGDYTIANGDANGCKVTVSAQNDVSVTVSGTVS